MPWYLNPALYNFRAEINERYPQRDKASDGTIGDAAHQETSSDHNPDPDGSVDAWDMDNNLRTGNDDSLIFNTLIPAFQRHPASQYWIYKRIIASRSSNWVHRVYDGTSAHLEHVHWNTRQGSETNNSPWLEPIVAALDDSNRNFQFLIWRVAAVTHMLPKFPSGSPVDIFNDTVPLVAAINDLTTTLNEVKGRVVDMQSDIDRILTDGPVLTLSEADRDFIVAALAADLKSGSFKFTNES
jgi:hypothetical protein